MIFLFSKNFWRHHIIFFIILSTALLNVFSWIFLILKIGWSDSNMPLHYNIYLGVDWFSVGYKIYTYPLLGLIILLINMVIASLIFGSHRHISFLLLLLSLLANITIIVSLIAIVFFQNYYF